MSTAEELERVRAGRAAASWWIADVAGQKGVVVRGPFTNPDAPRTRNGPETFYLAVPDDPDERAIVPPHLVMNRRRAAVVDLTECVPVIPTMDALAALLATTKVDACAAEVVEAIAEGLAAHLQPGVRPPMDEPTDPATRVATGGNFGRSRPDIEGPAREWARGTDGRWWQVGGEPVPAQLPGYIAQPTGHTWASLHAHFGPAYLTGVYAGAPETD